MGGNTLPTKFLPAEEVRRQHGVLLSLTLVRDLLDAIPNMVMILNEDRQIISANKITFESLGAAWELTASSC